MRISRRALEDPGDPAVESAPPPLQALAADSDVAVILAALICALVCVVGLALAARCACLRRHSAGAPPPPPPPPTKGLKEKALRSIPRLPFHAAAAAAGGGEFPADCPICLAEFADNDEIRVLPRCGHAFHVTCVDVWLRGHPSCPSCRQTPLVSGGGGAALAATPVTTLSPSYILSM
ncbi:unnamed protein product [Spirodela intermedia]|uniref:RING-type domain-containing protein n=1 Tax=Spirodela intermedia TaxID=51605 RepID=A0A7I8KR88_SPIIN|nr:unnamed protein product [Spirodela intermedia]